MHLRERVAQGGEATRGGNKVVLKPAKGHAAERARDARRPLGVHLPGALRAGQRLGLAHPSPPSRTLRGPAGRGAGPGTCRGAAEPFRDWWQRTRSGKGAAK
ncbi:hypothetical protein GCM10023238_00740 [Streptomyces heliomycini]